MADASENSNSFDAGKQHLGKVYAKAILGAAGANAGQILEELESLTQDVLKKLPQLQAVLASPRIDATAKEGMLDKAFGKKMSPVLLQSLKVMARHGRLDCLQAVAKAARQIYNEQSGRVEVVVRTAHPLDATLQKNIVASLAAKLGKEVDLRTEVQPEMLGGLVVKVGDTLFDGSLASRLERMRVDAIEETASKMRSSLARFETVG
jgi:F-type H+-transporting ATPase subunit delta